MKKYTKNIIYFIFYCLRNILNIFFNFKEISVFCYHSISDRDWDIAISPKIFEQQIIFLKKQNYYFANLNEIVDYIKGEKDLPQKTVAMTFDDGYEDNFISALPILKKYCIPATIFIVSDFINKPGKLNEWQIEEMKNSGIINFEYHSKSHKMLDILEDNKLGEEIKKENSFFYFSYPGGHYSQKAIDIIRQEGYKAAFSIKPGLIKKGDNLLLIKRNVIIKDMSFWQFKLRATKAIDWYVKIARFLKRYAK